MMRRGSFLGARLVLGVVVFAAATALAAAEEFRPQGVYVLSPFHADECRAATTESSRQLALDPESFHWRRIRAEAMLCDGLANEDPRRLLEAAASFRELEKERAGDLHVLIGIADAVRRRFPGSPEAAEALERALSMVPAEARHLREYLGSNLASVRQNLSACDGRESTAARHEPCVSRGEDDLDAALREHEAAPPTVHDQLEQAELLLLAGRLVEARERHRGALGDGAPEPGERERAVISARLIQLDALLQAHDNQSPGGER
jgi:hypothetical protein